MKRQIAAAAMLLGLTCAAALAAHMRDGAVIRNSGSTNFSGYTVKVWSDGATWWVHSNRAGDAIGTPATGHVPQTLAQTFLRDARQARSNRVTSRPCMKSASFGTSTVVTYHGWTSPDLECPGDGFAIALGSDMHKIVALLKIQGLPPARRIPMLPNEPRRVPSEMPSGQASPTPEPTPSAS